MTANIAKFFRHAPAVSLEKYFQKFPSPVSEAVDWKELPKNFSKLLIEAVDGLSEDDLAVLNTNAERINEMTDEIGQDALLAVISPEDFSDFKTLHNGHDRALYVFLRDQEAFKRAEDIRFSDSNRKSRMWAGYLGPKEAGVSVDPLDLELFKDKVSALSQASGKVKIEVFSRTKPYGDGQELELVQVMIYREGLPESIDVFDDDDLISQVVRPVREVVLSYEPQSGQIEIIADDGAIRENVVKAFAETMLGTEIDGERVPLKQYDLSKLLNHFDFPTDPDDGIESVKISMLKLRPYDSGNKVTLEVAAKEQQTIHQVSREWFATHDPLGGGFLVAQTKLTIKFAADSESPRGKTIPVKISYPNNCDLKSRTEKERLIGDKYLKKWGLLKEIEYGQPTD